MRAPEEERMRTGRSDGLHVAVLFAETQNDRQAAWKDAFFRLSIHNVTSWRVLMVDRYSTQLLSEQNQHYRARPNLL